MPLRLDLSDEGFEARFQSFLSEKRETEEDVIQAVKGILADVKTRGDAALVSFDGPARDILGLGHLAICGDLGGLDSLQGRACANAQHLFCVYAQGQSFAAIAHASPR